MTHVWKHPKYWREMRKLQASSVKPQAKPEPSSGSEASSHKPQASSRKLQA